MVFGFIGQQYLQRGASLKRFQEIVNNAHTTIHNVEESQAGSGAFLFLTVSQPAAQQPRCVPFFHLRLDEYRECRFADQWFWYQAQPVLSVADCPIRKEGTLTPLQQWPESITPMARRIVRPARENGPWEFGREQRSKCGHQSGIIHLGYQGAQAEATAASRLMPYPCGAACPTLSMSPWATSWVIWRPIIGFVAAKRPALAGLRSVPRQRSCDAVYVALAQQRNATLITLDGQQRERVPPDVLAYTPAEALHRLGDGQQQGKQEGAVSSRTRAGNPPPR